MVYEDKFILFGGHFLIEEGDYKYLNDVWVFDTKDNSWQMIKTKGDVPRQRYGHVSYIIPGTEKMIIFGGKGSRSTECYNDLYILDLNKFVWTSVNPVNNGPKSR